MIIDLRFSEADMVNILYGRKTCTSWRGMKGWVGDTFTLDGKTYVITLVEERSLRYVAHNLYTVEGYSSPDEFMRDWCELHDMCYEDYPPTSEYWDTMVYVHHFEEAKRF